MFSSYRLDQYNDPDSFVEQVAIIFAGYEDAVLKDDLYRIVLEEFIRRLDEQVKRSPR